MKVLTKRCRFAPHRFGAALLGGGCAYANCRLPRVKIYTVMMPHIDQILWCDELLLIFGTSIGLLLIKPLTHYYARLTSEQRARADTNGLLCWYSRMVTA